jgi:hypothetical protein
MYIVMDEEDKPDATERSPYEIRMRRIALGVLVVGLSIAAAVYAMAPPDGDANYPGIYVASVSNSKKYQLELERIGGKAAVVAVEFDDWFGSLWHGRKLAGTLAVLSVGVSLLCLLAAKLPPLDD